LSIIKYPVFLDISVVFIIWFVLFIKFTNKSNLDIAVINIVVFNWFNFISSFLSLTRRYDFFWADALYPKFFIIPYLNFVSSNPSVATVNDAGVVTPIAAGTATITATFNGQPTTGSLIINCTGTYINAPTPTLNPANVISIFSDAYTNVPVEYYNGYWQPWQTTVSNDFSVLGDNVLNYTNFNFVGIEFDGPTVNATSMTHFHMDAFIPGPIAPGRQLRVIVVDFGADGVFGGGDDTRHSTTFTAPTLVSQNWIPIEIPFSAMPGLLSRTNLAQIILEGGDNSILYVDNVYFHN